MHQFRISNMNFYIDTLDETYIRLNFVKAILKLEVKELLVYIEDYFKIIYFIIFKYLVNRESFCETTSTNS